MVVAGEELFTRSRAVMVLPNDNGVTCPVGVVCNLANVPCDDSAANISVVSA